MRYFYHHLIAITFGALACGPTISSGQSMPASGSGVRSLFDREVEFSKSCAAIGQHQTTYESLAENGILFRPGPKAAKAVLEKQEPGSIVLKTYPLFVDVSASEDFGYVHGVYEFQTNKPLTDPIDYGFFCTVWEKNESKQWKVVIAQAISTGVERPGNISLDFTFPEGSDKPRAYPKNVSKEEIAKQLTSLEKVFSDNWQKAPSSSLFTKLLADSGKIYRNGEMPTSDVDAVKRWAENSDVHSWKSINAGVANSGDMAFTYGSFKMKSRGEGLGHYLRVWKKQTDSSWKIVADVMKNPPKEKAGE